MAILKRFQLMALALGLSSCQQSDTQSHRQQTGVVSYSNVQKTSATIPQPAATNSGIWLGLVPTQASITTDYTVNNITLIDTDVSMLSELNWGLAQLTTANSQAKSQSRQSGFDITSQDHAYLLVDNSLQLFRDNARFTVVNKPISHTSMASELIDFLKQQELKNPHYGEETIASITLLTDSDISAADRQLLDDFLGKFFSKGHYYLHLIATPDTVDGLASWCQPDAQPLELVQLQQAAPGSLRLSICDPDWYGHFRSIGKRVIYDHAIVRIVLPTGDAGAGKIPFMRFDGQTFPQDRMVYDASQRLITMKLVDMPASYQNIEIGYAP